LPVAFIVYAGVRSVEIDSVTTFLSVLPEALEDYSAILISFALEEYEFSDSVELPFAEFSDIEISFGVGWVVIEIGAHAMHLIVIPITDVLIVVFEGIGAKPFFFSIFQLTLETFLFPSAIFCELEI